jgi:hypothetical protein
LALNAALTSQNAEFHGFWALRVRGCRHQSQYGAEDRVVEGERDVAVDGSKLLLLKVKYLDVLQEHKSRHIERSRYFSGDLPTRIREEA